MARSIQLYARNLTAEQAEAWLAGVFEDVKLVRREPALTFALRSEDAMSDATSDANLDEHNPDAPHARVFVAEGIEGGAYTSIWFQGTRFPGRPRGRVLGPFLKLPARRSSATRTATRTPPGA